MASRIHTPRPADRSAGVFRHGRRGRARRWPVGIAAACTLALALGACSSSGASTGGSSGSGNSVGSGSKSPITVAGIEELTGPFASGFAPAAEGYKAAVVAINAAGGIDGHPLQLAGPFDSQSTPAGGTTSAQQAIAAHPAFVIAGSASPEVAGNEPVLDQAGIPWLDFSAEVTGNIPLHFSTNTPIKSLMKAMLDQALASSSARPLRIAFAYLDSPSVAPQVAVLKQLAGPADAQVVATEQTTDTMTSFTSQAAALVRANPDVIFDVDSVTNTVLAASALSTAGFHGPILGSSAVGAYAALQKIGLPNMLGYQESQVAANGSALYKAAAAVGAQNDAMTTNYFSSGFGAMYAMALVLRKCGPTCTSSQFAKTAETMGNINVPDNAYFGPIQFSSSSHFGLTAMQFFKLNSSKTGIVPAGKPLELQS
jgi:ABC-type branched-subunit amino acid transport system substrate-binding protein